LIATAMQTLQALHQEFDIANAAGRQLDIQAIAQPAFGRRLLVDALPRFGNRLHRAKIQRALINQGLHEIQQGGAGLTLS